MFNDSNTDKTSPSNDRDLPRFRCEMITVMNGFILVINDKTFVVQTEGHEPKHFEDVLGTLRTAYGVVAD